MKKPSKLQELHKLIKNKASRSRKEIHYTVPDMWNCFGYEGTHREDGQVEVKPYKFYQQAIEHVG